MTTKTGSNFIAELFKKKPLPPEVSFKEKPSLVLLLLVYVLGIAGLVIMSKLYTSVSPLITAQVTSFFKGLKAEWVDGLLNKATTYIYLLIVLLVAFYHLRRELTTYTLTKNEIIIKKGLFVRKETFVPISKVLSVSVHTNLIGLAAFYGTIYIDVGGYGYPLTMENVAKPKEKAKQILEVIGKN